MTFSVVSLRERLEHFDERSKDELFERVLLRLLLGVLERVRDLK